MRRHNTHRILLFNLFLLALFSCQSSSAQEDTGKSQRDDVLRINTELVQTGVTVFDKKGHFVDGLRKQDFELRVDGRIVPVSFFESIIAGTRNDKLLRATARQDSTPSNSSASEPSFRQRTIIFFLDDLHLSLDGVGRTKKMLNNFINTEMGDNDLVAIASASGHIGFLQQFTDNKEVLQAAVERIGHVPYVVSDYGANRGSPMTENMALTIERKGDSDVFDFYVEDCLKWASRGVTRAEKTSMRRHCEVEVQNRARQLLIQAGTVTAGTYYSLETLLDSAERMAGSKLAFFISDGFLADTGPRGPIATNQLARITNKARRAGVVIYTIDARGLVSGAIDATGNLPLDPNGRLETANLREIAASQDALNALAEDTGGRALRDQNYFDHFVNDALSETSRYYLIAWRPEAKDDKTEIVKKIEIKVIGHPELTVRSARNFLSTSAIASVEKRTEAKEDKSSAKQEQKPDVELRGALNDFYPKHGLPLQLSLTYLDSPANGSMLTTSVQAPTELLYYGNRNTDPAGLSIAGVVLSDKGKPVTSFKTGLKVNPSQSKESQPNASTVIYNYPSPLKPGIYQVRVAARDDHSGILGSAMQWIVIPDLLTNQLALSSLIIGLQNVTNKTASDEHLQWSVDKTFGQNSRLKFMTFIYNRGKSLSNDLAARVQVYKDGQEVISTPFKPIAQNKQSDPDRIPFNAEINLAGLQSGRYILIVTVEDRASQKTASQRSAFYIE
jgi:VWFA-related protein